MKELRPRSSKISRKFLPPEIGNSNLTVTKTVNYLKLKWENLISMILILHHLHQQKRRIKSLARGQRITESRNYLKNKLRESQLDSMRVKMHRMSKNLRFLMLSTTLTRSTLLKMAKVKKGKERLSANSKFWGQNWGRT